MHVWGRAKKTNQAGQAGRAGGRQAGGSRGGGRRDPLSFLLIYTGVIQQQQQRDTCQHSQPANPV